LTNEDTENKLKEYYSKAKLELSPDFSRKHIRFLLCKDEMRKISDRIYDVEQFRSHLTRLCPLRVFSSVAYYLNPTIVGKKEFDNAILLYTDMLLEDDFDDLKDAKKWAKTLWKWLDKNKPKYKKEMLFSGGRGFHIKLIKWDRDIVSKIADPKERVKVIRQMREDLCDEIEKAGISLDRAVCVDERRISGVPLTIHHSGNLIQPIKLNKISTFKPKKVLDIQLDKPIKIFDIMSELRKRNK